MIDKLAFVALRGGNSYGSLESIALPTIEMD